MNIKDPFFIEKAVHTMTQRARKKFKGTDEEFKQHIQKKIDKLIPGLYATLRKIMIKHSFALAKNTASYDRKVCKEISSGYKDTLDFLDPFIEFNNWIGENFYFKYRKIIKDYNERLKVDTLIEIHCRACQIASEVKLLVRNGYADGALARWRSLHELCITFLFLFDNDTDVLHMYLDYEIIEAYKKMNRYDGSLPKIGWRPTSTKTRKDLEDERKQLILKYGKEFGDEYGWTMKVLPKGSRHIRGIEDSVQQDHLRGVYSWASENVHAGVSGNKNRLGLTGKNKNKFLRGSSPDGIFDPVQFATYSLVEMSGTLLDMEDSALNKMYIELLLDMQKMLVQNLNEADKKFRRKSRVKKKRSALVRSKPLKNSTNGG